MLNVNRLFAAADQIAVVDRVVDAVVNRIAGDNRVVVVAHIVVHGLNQAAHLPCGVNVLQLGRSLGRLTVQNRRNHGNEGKHCHRLNHQAAQLVQLCKFAFQHCLSPHLRLNRRNINHAVGTDLRLDDG